MSKEIKMNVFDLLQSELYYKHVLVIQVFTVWLLLSLFFMTSVSFSVILSVLSDYPAMLPCVCPDCWLLICILSSWAAWLSPGQSLLSGRVWETSTCPADLDVSHLEVAGVDPGAGHRVHRPVQQALVLLQLGGLVLVQDELYDLRAHLEPPPQVLLHHLLQHVLHAHHLLLHGCRKLSQTSSWPSCQADLVYQTRCLRGGWRRWVSRGEHRDVLQWRAAVNAALHSPAATFMKKTGEVSKQHINTSSERPFYRRVCHTSWIKHANAALSGANRPLSDLTLN